MKCHANLFQVYFHDVSVLQYEARSDFLRAEDETFGPDSCEVEVLFEVAVYVLSQVINCRISFQYEGFL